MIVPETHVYDAISPDRAGRRQRLLNASCAIVISSLVAGCASIVVPTLRQPERLYSNQEEMDEIRKLAGAVAPNSPELAYFGSVEQRNNFISLRMYAIDVAYTKYESQLTHEAQETSLGSSLVSLGLTSAATIAPVGQTPRILSAIATGVTGAGTAYDKDILLSQAIQNLETQMRTDRNNQAAVILSNMQCSVQDYPYGTALSDIEEYYRAGTMTNALIGISKTVSSAEVASKAIKAANSASPTVAASGNDQLAADAAVVRSQGAAGVTSVRCNSGSIAAPRFSPVVIPAPAATNSSAEKLCLNSSPIKERIAEYTKELNDPSRPASVKEDARKQLILTKNKCNI